MVEHWFDKLLNWHVAAWAAFWLNAVALLRIRNERLRDRNTERSGDWQRLRDERDRLQKRLDDCEKERVQWMGRAITAEATLQGYGELRQIRAISEASKRTGGNGK